MTLIQLYNWAISFKDIAKMRKALHGSAHIRMYIRNLSKHYLKKEIAGCSNCIEDALHELIHYYKKNGNMETKKVNFKICNGTLLYDTFTNKFENLLTAATITDDLALFHLATNPNAKKKFIEMPENVDELIAEKQIELGIDTDIFGEQENSAADDFNNGGFKPTKKNRKK